MPAQLRRKRQRSIRVLLTAIFIVPLASLLGLWGFAASVTVSNAVQEHNFNTEDRLFGGWAQTLFAALATEREDAFVYLTSGRQISVAPYNGQKLATTEALTAFQVRLNASPSQLVPSARPALRAFERELAWLNGSPGYPGIRPQVVAGKVSAMTAFLDYSAIIDSEFQLYAQMVVVNDTSLYMQAIASVNAGRAVEMASREATLLGGALAAGGKMTTAERTVFAQTAVIRQLLMSDALRELQPSLGSGYQQANESPAYKRFAGLENMIIGGIGARNPAPISPLLLAVTLPALFKDYQAAEAQDRIALSSLGTKIGNQLLLEVGLAGGAGLVAVTLSVFLMLRFGRRISRELTGLQHAALELAEDRLPRVVARLSKGEEVDVAAEAAPLTPGRILETARVADAFSSVQRTAVEAAVGQSRLRSGVSQVFRNLAWRSQSLLHRQLTLLDAMERRSSEPETLEELFQLDHLTTRMRRHAEGLIILAGASPGRGWRDPVPMMDVLRGAIAEVEDYKRVTVICESVDAVVGSAVADIIHLLAELIENAATYSPASTEVMIRAERVANGFAVEVEDRGIGIGADEMAAFNDRLANPPEFDIADSNQLGLFVVARLAAKQHVRVTLRSSPFGGTAAIVLLPHPIVVVNEPVAGQVYDVFRPELPTAARQRDLSGRGAERPAALPAGRLASYLLAEDGSRESDGPARDRGAAAHASNAGPAAAAGLGAGPAAAGSGAALAALASNADGAAPDVPRPWLPRRVRQASLAPQLRADGAAEEATNGDASAAANGDGPSPADSRALVEALRVGLERARAAETPAEESWPSPAEESWPSPAGRPPRIDWLAGGSKQPDPEAQ